MICVIDRKDTTIEYKAGCLYIRQGKKQRRPLPINQLEQFVVYGNPLVQTAVWRNLAEASVPVLMLSSRGKPQTAMLDSGLAVRLPLRRLQHRLADIAPAATELAGWFIQRKFASYPLATHLLTTEYHLPESAKKRFNGQRGKAISRLHHAEHVGQVMGAEGYLAHAWFELLSANLPARFNFSGRNRRPPLDPVNSLLSLGYTLLFNEVHQALIIEGFDPSLGFLHQEYPGRTALALDFAEIFRTGVDAFVLHFLSHTPLDSSSFFYRKQDGCRLSKATRPLFFQAWAQHRENWPRYDSPDYTGQQAPIRELLLGQMAEARKYMTTLEKRYAPDEIFCRKNNEKPDQTCYGAGDS